MVYGVITGPHGAGVMKGWRTMASSTRTDDSGWNDVDEEQQMVFDTVGDVFIGKYDSKDMAGKIPQGHFSNDAGNYFSNLGHDLNRKLSKVPFGSLVRIELVDRMDTGQATPMNVFKVQYK